MYEACRIKHTYPPRFTVAVTPTEGVVRSSKIRLTFVGATNLYTEEVQLNLEQCELFSSVCGERNICIILNLAIASFTQNT